MLDAATTPRPTLPCKVCGDPLPPMCPTCGAAECCEEHLAADHGEVPARAASVHIEGTTLLGPPRTLSSICRRLGFRNECRRDSVYLTPAKAARVREWMAMSGGAT